MSPLPMKLLMSWEDIGTDHPDVPAKILLSGHGTWPTEEPPRRTVCNFTSLTFSCTILLHFYFIEFYFMYDTYVAAIWDLFQPSVQKK